MTLDGVMHTLHAEDLMICDAEEPMPIAGVFGGIKTGATEDTKSIFLESAYFDPVSIRKTAEERHGLRTDASFRFERGVWTSIMYRVRPGQGCCFNFSRSNYSGGNI